MSAATAETAPISDDLLAMDVADTLQHEASLAVADAAARAEALRVHYRRFGIDLSDRAINEGIAALNDNRYRHIPKPQGLSAGLARLYISRRSWGPATLATILAVAVVLGGYVLAYQPYRNAQLQQAEYELAQTMPATMDALYATIHEETKVQLAENQAAAARDRGLAAAKQGNRAAAQQAIADLTAIRDALRAEYQLKIVDGSDGKWGFWNFPQSNSEATNYYLVVQAVGTDGRALTLPIRSEDNGRTEKVSVWGERVPEDVYRAVEADKQDDGTIEHNLIAVKEFGFLTPGYLVPTLGAEVTRW